MALWVFHPKYRVFRVILCSKDATKQTSSSETSSICWIIICAIGHDMLYAMYNSKNLHCMLLRRAFFMAVNPQFYHLSKFKNGHLRQCWSTILIKWFGLASWMQNNWFGIPKYLHGRNCVQNWISPCISTTVALHSWLFSCLCACVWKSTFLCDNNKIWCAHSERNPAKNAHAAYEVALVFFNGVVYTKKIGLLQQGSPRPLQ